MSLAQKNWNAVSIHRIVLAWLRAERATHLARQLAAFPVQVLAPAIAALLDNADLNDSDENRARLRLLYLIRSMFVVEIPPDTVWYEVQNMTHDDLGELHAVNYGNWNNPADRNELFKVAARKRLQIKAPPPDWEPPILWGHSQDGPFTILEGNHRLTAYAASESKDLNIPVLIGLSPLRCVWHILDECNFLIQDLMARK